MTATLYRDRRLFRDHDPGVMSGPICPALFMVTAITVVHELSTGGKRVREGIDEFG
jgi:hypothetical protein